MHSHLKLCDHRPSQVTKGQWNLAVGWTLQLHSECASSHSAVDSRWQEQFANELDQRIASGVKLTDIDWIWEQYAIHTLQGRLFSNDHHPLRSPEFKNAPERWFPLDIK